MNNKTVVQPSGKPQPSQVNGQATRLDRTYYTNVEGAYDQQLIREYIDHQSRTTSNVKLYSDIDRRREYGRQYGVNFSFHNYTNAPVVVVDRLGLPVTLETEPRHPDEPPCLLIRKELYFDKQPVSQKSYRNLQSLGKLQGSEINRIMPELARHLDGHNFGRCIGMEYYISEAEIREGDGCLYHLPTDMVISFLSAAETMRHPSSPEYLKGLAEYIPNFPTGMTNIGLAFRYVSANVKSLPKYVRAGHHVFMLPPEKNEAAKLGDQVRGKDRQIVEEELTEYVELIYPAHMDATRPGVQGYRVQRMSLELARDQLGVYDTLEEAQDPLIIAEREKRQHKDELAAQAAKHAEVVRGLKEQITGQNDDIRGLKQTIEDLRANRNAEMERLREENEREAHKRRMSNEGIKLAMGLATAAVTLVGLYVKIKPKSV